MTHIALPNGGKLLGFESFRLATATSQTFIQNMQTAINGLEVAYTPVSAASELLINVDFSGYYASGFNNPPLFGLFKDSSPVGNVGSLLGFDTGLRTRPDYDANFIESIKASYRYIDNAANTDIRTYKATAVFIDPPDNFLYMNRDSVDATIRSACFITVMEVAS
jgi:hypothetical protein